MKKLVLALTIVMITVAGSALALQWEDNIGLYYYADGSSCTEMAPGYYPNAVFLAVTNSTLDSIGGFEAKIFGDNISLVNIAYNGNALNFGTRPDEYIVGYETPLTGSTVLLAGFDLYVQNADAGYAFIDGVYFHSLDNKVPALLDGVDANLVVEAHQAMGDAGDPLLRLNAECDGVDNEETTWDSVKSLYR